jgi:hypothetical protein
MKRWHYYLAAAGALLLIGWGLHKTGLFCRGDVKSALRSAAEIKSDDPMDTPSGWRYRQNQPHHWRYIMLQK